jgi:hypothetical protein
MWLGVCNTTSNEELVSILLPCCASCQGLPVGFFEEFDKQARRVVKGGAA